MTITQTLEIPADRRITVEVPREIRTGTVILTFTPPETVLCNEVSRAKRRKVTEAEEIEYINRHADRLNAEAMDVLSYQVPLWDDKE